MLLWCDDDDGDDDDGDDDDGDDDDCDDDDGDGNLSMILDENIARVPRVSNPSCTYCYDSQRCWMR